MVYAVFLSGILIACFYIARGFKSKYSTLAVIGWGGAEREKIVKLSFKRQTSTCCAWEKITNKLDVEIRIFNKMNIVMPCRRGVAIMYIDIFSRLYENPKWICNTADGYEKLMYLLAAVNLNALTHEYFTSKQLLKNCLYVFGARAIVKKKKPISCVLNTFYLTPFKQPAFKFLQGGAFARFASASLPFDIQNSASDAPIPLRSRYTASYAVYYGQEARVKHCVDEILPIEAFAVFAPNCSRFIWKTGEEKMQFDLTHTADTFYYVNTKARRAVGLYVRGRGFNFGSTIAQSQSTLDVFVNSEGLDFQVFVVYGNSKQEVVAHISKLKQRNGTLGYLAEGTKRAVIAEIEKLYERAHFSRFVVGEDLREKYAQSVKYVPTLHLPTLVYCIETASDFFAVVDSFGLYKSTSKACKNLNIVLLYSSQNDNVREIINAYVNRGEVRELIECGVFLFFVNKVTAKEGAVYYLSKMADYDNNKVRPKCKESNLVEVTEHISNTYPITHSVFARNTTKQSVSTTVRTQISFSAPLNVVSKSNSHLNVCSINNGRASTYKLPAGCRVFDDNGAEIKDNDHIATGVSVWADIRLSAFEERKLDIIRNDGIVSASDRKNAFIGALQDIRVSAADARLVKLFSLQIETAACPLPLLASLKAAIKTADQNLFYALLGKREALPFEIYKILVERVLGVKLVRGSIQLLPKVELTGGFTLSFAYQEKQFEFVVKPVPSGFSVRYGEHESYNFLQVGV